MRHECSVTLSGRVECRYLPVQVRGLRSFGFANESHQHLTSLEVAVTRQPYLTGRSVDDVRHRLSDRQRSVLADVALLRTVSGRHLRQLHYADSASGARAARRDLGSLTELRVLQRLDRRIGGVRAGSDGFVYALDILGQRLTTTEPRRRWWPATTPTVRTLEHRLATSQIYVDLRAAEALGELELVDFEAEPSAWRSFTGIGGARLVLKPDAYAVVAVGDLEHHWFCETDRATESLPWIQTKARQYVRYWQSGREQALHGLFPRVLWIAPTEKRAGQLTEALAALPPEHWQLFAVTTADQAAVRLGGLDQSSNTPKEVTS